MFDFLIKVYFFRIKNYWRTSVHVDIGNSSDFNATTLRYRFITEKAEYRLNYKIQFRRISSIHVIDCSIIRTLTYLSNKRDSSFVLKKKPKHLMDLKIKLLPNEVFTTIIDDVSPKLGYKVESYDVEKGNIVLSSSTRFTWGFFYPIFITSQDDICLVEIGIKSKLIQGGPIGGPLRTKQHNDLHFILRITWFTNQRIDLKG